jgi:quercetin dioxygenase-like cupin family protein
MHSGRMTFVYWNIAKDAPLPKHSHEHEQVVHMLEGEFELVVRGTPHRLQKGDVFAIPSNAEHSGIALTDCKIMDAFCPVREDYVVLK